MKSLIDYIITEGRKQKVTNWKQFNQEIKQRYGYNTLEYFKGLSDYLMIDLMRKLPIKFREVRTEDIKMGYSRIDAKRYSILYELNNHVIEFIFNSFFANPFAYIKIDDKDVTGKFNNDRSGDLAISVIMCDKEKLALFADMLDKLQ